MTNNNIQILTWIFFIRYVRFQCRWLELTRTRNNGIQGTQSFFSINLITRKKTIKKTSMKLIICIFCTLLILIGRIAGYPAFFAIWYPAIAIQYPASGRIADIWLAGYPVQP